jgi:predicted nucleotidyltransferase
MVMRTDRAALAAEVRSALEGCCSGSHADLVGSLAAGTADVFSDIDIAWVVPDERFPACLPRGLDALRRVQSIEGVRTDPDFYRSDRRRLLFVRFAEVPLFWRLDLDVRAVSIADDVRYDTENPAARAGEGEWSRQASALANAIGAVKAVARRRDADARGLLDRGFARIDETDHATGAWADDVARLAGAAALRDPSLAELAAQVTALTRSGEFPGFPVP